MIECGAGLELDSQPRGILDILRISMAVNLGTVDLPIDDFVTSVLLYFRATGDRKSKAWIFRDDVPSDFCHLRFVLEIAISELKS
jgi:hypothetical protein